MKRTTICMSAMMIAAMSGAGLARNDSQSQHSNQNRHRNQTSFQQSGNQSQHQNRSWNYSQQQAQRQRGQSQQGRQQAQRFSGRVQSTRVVNLSGQRQSHVLAKVRLNNNRTVIADLGPVSQLRQQGARLSQGAQLQGWAQAGRINNQPVLVVNRFREDGRVITANLQQNQQQQRQSQQVYGFQGDQQRRGQQQRMRQGQQRRQAQQGQQRQQAQQQMRRFRGHVMEHRPVRLSGEREPHLLAKVRLESGRTVIMDLGPISNLRQQNARVGGGTQIEAQGTAGRINNQPILVINRFIGDGVATAIPLDQNQQRQARQTRGRQQQYGFRGEQAGGGRNQAMQQMRQRHQRQRQQLQRRQQMERQRIRQQRRQGQRQGRQGQQRQQQSRQQAQHFSGQIQSTRAVNLSGQRGQHVLAKIRLQNGQTVVANLGPASNLRRQGQRLSPGTRIEGEAHAGRINDQPVLVVNRFIGDGRMTVIRFQQDQQRQSSNRGRDQRRSRGNPQRF